jgi:pilus assembly protein FimV
MFRKMAVLAALLVLTAPRLFALGLGEINMQSALNQPMQAVINLTSSAGTPIETIKVSLASLEAHQRAGLTKAAVLANFKFTVEQAQSGNAVVRVTSTDPVREPYLEFLLQLDWPNGRLLRQYTVLIDPPVTMPATPAVPPAPVAQAATRPATPAPVRQPRPPVARPSPAPATVTVAPAATDEYGPIRRSETLWSIAERVRPDSGITMHQMMLALLRANPEAFLNGNMNQLRAGSTLKVPERNEIVAFSAREALAETRRQYNEWKTDSEATETSPAVEAPDAGVVPATAQADAARARLQLVAPEGDAVEGAAMPGDPETASGKSGSVADLTQQLALATEEAEAGKAQSRELQSRVDELEEQIETMKRLLELKDNALAGLQNEVAGADGAVATPDTAAEQAAAQTAAADTTDTAEADTAAAVAEAPAVTPAGIVSKVMDNPILAGAGILVALLLGGFLWLANRQKNTDDLFDDDLTLESRLASQAGKPDRDWPQPEFDVDVEESVPEPVEHVSHETAENDPITESEVYLAYGRIQQAEDVLQAALQREPDNDAIRVKLLEVYHIAGNTAAFEQAASDFRDGVSEDDERWIKVASMGYTMAPHNDLYRAGAPEQDNTIDFGQRQDNSIDFDTDLSGRDVASGASADDDFATDPDVERDRVDSLPETIEYGLDELEDEDSLDGTLASEDEVTTKLDLARAYIDMDDKDSARSILGEVMEEGNTVQKQEAEKIYSQIG